MNDRQLLELAARAAGYDVIPHPNYKYNVELMWLLNGKLWNPLTDDGDALRLAVKLELHNAVRDGYQHLDSDGDIYAATRRAIVRAAAEIGKEMA